MAQLEEDRLGYWLDKDIKLSLEMLLVRVSFMKVLQAMLSMSIKR